MGMIYRFFLVLCMSIALAHPTLANNDKEKQLETLAKELLPWVSKATGYKAEGVKVTVVLLEPRVINMLVYREKYKNQTDALSASVGNVVFLPNEFSVEKEKYKLVHEIVHVLQSATEKVFFCEKESEYEAYKVQDKYVLETGIGEKTSFLFKAQFKCRPVHEDE